MDRLSVLFRRTAFAAPVVLISAVTTAVMHRILAPGGMTAAEWGMVVLFAVNIVWIAMWFWNAMLGFAIRLFGRAPDAIAAPILETLDRSQPIASRTAIVMPVHNEDPDRSFRRMAATVRSLDAAASGFEFFVLSDTTDPALAEREVACFQTWRRALAPARLHYRRRIGNKGRKAGNIAEFGRRWGARFDYLVVLDADSIMSGSLILDLVRLMQANPDAGIIQTVPRPVLAETLFGRLQQFGARVMGEAVNTGVSFWQLGDGNYFGHNAIIRTAPFFRHCILPVLPGSGPLSGEILSHDFVEAAYMRRAGWKVWNIPIGKGSYEEIPPTLLDFARRDRRWCQGNLQHARILTERGLHPLSRLHLATGVMSYVSSPLWLLFILLSVATLIRNANPELNYVGPGSDAFAWLPEEWNALAIGLFGSIMAMLVAPKLLGALALVRNPTQRPRYGGALAIWAGTAAEIGASIIRAPVMMIFHTSFLLAILAGSVVAWDPQARDGRRLALRVSLRVHLWSLAFGFGLIATVAALAPAAVLWFVPLAIGPLLSPWLTSLSSRSDLGAAAARWRLLLTPEETEPAAEIRPLRLVPPVIAGFPAGGTGRS